MPDYGIPRFNTRGQVWCFDCWQYLDASRFRYVTYPSLGKPKYWSYCIECQRQKDRDRWAERRKVENERRLIRQARDQQRARFERAEFAQKSILTLRKRGFTKAEIARLLDTSMTSILAWERRERRVTTAATNRIGILMAATAHMPLGEPAYRRRLPHPEFDRIYAKTHQRIQAIPLRSRWATRKDAA